MEAFKPLLLIKPTVCRDKLAVYADKLRVYAGKLCQPPGRTQKNSSTLARIVATFRYLCTQINHLTNKAITRKLWNIISGK